MGDSTEDTLALEPRVESSGYRTIAALPLILGPEVRELADFLDQCRTRRHDVTYEALSTVSDGEARELIDGVAELDKHVRKWLRSRQHPSS